MLKILFLFWGVLFIVGVVSCGGLLKNPSSEEIFLEEKEPIMSSSPIKVDMSKYLLEPAQLEFASDGSEYISGWCYHPRDGRQTPYGAEIGQSIVINFEGEVIDATIEDGKYLKKEFVDLFPTISNRQRYADFIKHADDWRLTSDYENGVKLRRINTSEWVVQFWKFGKKPKYLWKTILPETYGSILSIDFLKWKEQASILICFSGSGKTTYIVSCENGKLLETISFIPYEIIQAQSFKKIKSRGEIEIFSIGEAAIDNNKRLIALGDSNTRRVKIFSIDPPNKMIHEFYPEDYKRRPQGAHWTIYELRFYCRGKYLIVRSSSGAVYSSNVYHPTEIYETDSWKLCWYENKYNVHNVTISPNGKRIAFTRGMVLEMGPFNPNPKAYENIEKKP